MAKLLKKTPILQADLFTVFEDTIEVASGEKKVFKSAIRNPSVSVVPLDDENNVYLIDQYRYLHNTRLLEIVAGMIDEGEDPLTAAKRELKEELGIVASIWENIGTMQAAGSIITWDQTFFLARGLKFEDQELEDTEDIKSVKMPLEKAVSYAFSGKIHTSSTFCAIILANKLVNNV